MNCIKHLLSCIVVAATAGPAASQAVSLPNGRLTNTTFSLLIAVADQQDPAHAEDSPSNEKTAPAPRVEEDRSAWKERQAGYVNQLKTVFPLLKTDPGAAARGAAPLAELEDVDKPIRAMAAWVAGSGFALSGSSLTARGFLETAVRLSEETENKRQQLQSLRYLSRCLLDLNCYQHGITVSQAALELARELSFPPSYQGKLHCLTASHLAGAGDTAAAIREFLKAAVIAEDSGDKELSLRVLINQAELCTLADQHDMALLMLQTAEKETGEADLFTRCYCQLSRADIMLTVGRLDDAENLADTARDAVSANNLAPLQPRLLRLLGDIALFRGDTPTAAVHWAQALADETVREDPILTADLRKRLQLFCGEAHTDPDQVTEQLRAILKEAGGRGDVHSEQECRWLLAGVLTELGKEAEAAEVYRRYAEVQQDLYRDLEGALAEGAAHLHAVRSRAKATEAAFQEEQTRRQLSCEEARGRTLSLTLLVLSAALIWIGLLYRGRGRICRRLDASNQELKNQKEREIGYVKSIAARQKTESLAVMTAGVCHDVNNHLAAILNHSELAMLHVTDATASEALQGLREAAGRAAGMTDRLKAYLGRAHADSLCSLNHTLRENSDLIASVFRGRKLPEIRLSPEDLVVGVDSERIIRLFVSLLSNARDAVPDGGCVELSLGCRTFETSPDDATLFAGELTAGSYAVMTVCDDGEGITPDDLAKVTDPYFSTRQPGRGLGLTEVAGIIRSAEGAFQIESRVGRGTTVTVYLPLSDRTPDTDFELSFIGESRPPKTGLTETARFSETIATPSSHLPPMAEAGRVLVVDDNELVRKSTGAVLRASGYLVEEASSAQEAMQILRATPGISCVLTDYSMPAFDGDWLVKAIRQLIPELPVIVVSGFASAAASDHDPGTRYVEKPWQAEILVAEVKDASATFAPG